MKKISSLLLAVATLSTMTSCSLMERWGVAYTRMKVIDEHRESIGGRDYLVRRYLVNKDTGETFTESLQIVDNRFANDPGTVDRLTVIGARKE